MGQSNICGASGASTEALRLQSVRLAMTATGTTFNAEGQGIKSIEVNVFSLNGAVVFDQHISGTELAWSQTTSGGAPVANGTYLYVVKAKGDNGQTINSGVMKLVILR